MSNQARTQGVSVVFEVVEEAEIVCEDFDCVGYCGCDGGGCGGD